MSYHDKLIVEITKKLDRLEAAGDDLVATWVAHEICKDHRAGLAGEETEDKHFWQHCGYQETRDQVRRCINKRLGLPELEEIKSKQLLLPGYAHVQRYYMVVRKGEEVGVATERLTDAELDEKSNLYMRMGAACFEHARELLRFKVRRHGRAPAVPAALTGVVVEM